MSLWEVLDRASREVMHEFCKNIISGKTDRNRALRRATLKQVEIVKKGYGDPNPLYRGRLCSWGKIGTMMKKIKSCLCTLKVIAKIIAGLFIFYLVGIGILMELWEPRIDISSFDYASDIEKTAPDGTRYKINNGPATFDLDVAKPDKHCDKIFRDYKAALEYCRDSGLPVIPSVHLVQGKLKQFDDGLCAALETAVQRGVPGEERLSKVAALSELLEELLKVLARIPTEKRGPAESAAVHLSTALSLGGNEPRLGPDLADRVRKAKKRFLSQPLKSEPAGFWTWNEQLQSMFRQDRYLFRGFNVGRNPSVCVVLAAVISRDKRLSEAFARFREFDSKLTNPSVCIDPETSVRLSRCLSFQDVATVLPSEMSIDDILEPETTENINSELQRRFGKNAGFALVSYSESRESDILHGLILPTGKSPMQVIIDAVRSGRLSLKPKPNSGWYDYQWYAMETLLLPEKARESHKLRLSDNYKKRLENAFKTSLTKDRDTHIKHYPIPMAGITERKPKIEIGPEFSAEPTATVYLRYARAYRFLRNAMHAVLGREFLRQIHRSNGNSPPVRTDLDTELREMALLCYGLYERLAPEIGQEPVYLPDEMNYEDIAAAKNRISQWISCLTDDPDLGRDTRVVVPAFDEEVSIHYWATAGVRLERVVYKYNDEPYVSDSVEPVFVPTNYYLPTDIFLEFESPRGAPLTRDEYRNICDRYEDEVSLRKHFGAVETEYEGGLFIVFIVLIMSAFIFRKHLRGLNIRGMIRAVTITAGLFAVLCIAGFVYFPMYPMKILVKYVPEISVRLVPLVEKIAYSYHSSPYDEDIGYGMIELLDDPNPLVRATAAVSLEYLYELYCLSCSDFDEEKLLRLFPDIENRLRTATEDEMFEVRWVAVSLLRRLFTNDDTIHFLASKLKTDKHVDRFICSKVFEHFATIGGTKEWDTVLSYTEDSRESVRYAAIWSLSKFTISLEKQILTLYKKAFGFWNRGDRFSSTIMLGQISRITEEDASFPNYPDAAQAKEFFAWLLMLQGSDYYNLAMEKYEAALDIMENALGSEHPDVVRIMDDLAWVYEKLGYHAEAKDLYNKSLSVKTKFLGPEHPETLTTLSHLVSADSETKEDYIRKKLMDIMEKALGSEHPDVAGTMDNLASVYGNFGYYVEAENLYNKSLSVKKEFLGPEHPETLSTLTQLVSLYKNKGDHVKAESLCLSIIDTKKRTYGSEHPETAASLHDLADVYKARGDYDKANPLFRERLTMFKEALGTGHPRAVRRLNERIEFHTPLSSYRKAEFLCKIALAIRKKTLGPEHPDVAASLKSLAEIHRSLGDIHLPGRQTEPDPH